MFDAVKANVPDDPVNIALLGPIGVMLSPQQAAYLKAAPYGSEGPRARRLLAEARSRAVG